MKEPQPFDAFSEFDCFKELRPVLEERFEAADLLILGPAVLAPLFRRDPKRFLAASRQGQDNEDNRQETRRSQLLVHLWFKSPDKT